MLDYESLLSERVKVVKPSGIRKFFDYAATMEDVISLGVGEPDFETPWQIRRAGIQSLEKGKTFYTSNWGLADLRREIAGLAQRRYGLSYSPDKEILVTVGGSEGIDNAIRALVSFGDEVLIPEPSFVCYTPLAVMAGGVPVPLPTYEKDEFKLTPENLRAAITPRTKLLVLPFPNNPTGAIMTREELEGIAAVLRDTNVVVISDEIYCSLTYGTERHVCFAELPGMKERTFTMNGMSKAYAMDGWRLGYVAAPEEYILAMNKFHQHNTTCAPNFVQVAAIAALNEEGDEVKEMVKEYQRRRDYAVKAINEIPGLHCECPKGAFYIFINCKSLNMKSADLSAYLLEEAKIALVPGDVFGPGGEGYLRMSFANSYENVVSGCEQLKKAVALLQQKP